MEGSSNPGFVSDQRKPSGLLEIATNDVNSHTYVYEPNLRCEYSAKNWKLFQNQINIFPNHQGNSVRYP